MSDNSGGNINRIAKNSLFLYIRMFFTMAVSLYTSQVILNALGVEDFGINNAVAGFVSMFSLISASVSSSISRFLTFELGHGDTASFSKVFSTSLNIQILLVIIVVLLAESGGLWFVNNRMTIPPERLHAANMVFQFSLVSFCISLISIPYNASIIAHEDMSSFAYISIAEATLKLGIAFIVSVAAWDKLVVYSFLMMTVSAVIRMIYGIYSKKRYGDAVRYRISFDRKMLGEMASFAGWNYLGAGASILRTHGLNLLMNIFFGVTVNAARAIATQVETAVTQFVGNFTMAVNPQIVKSYACNDLKYMHKLVCLGAKYSFFLMLLIVVPIFIETPYILRLWLKTVPDGTVLFLRLSLLVILTDTLSTTVSNAISASGNIKAYHIRVSLIVMSVFPLTYICYRLGAEAYICYILCIAAMVLKIIVQLPLARDIVGLPVNIYLKSVIFKIIPVLFVIPVMPFIVYMNMEENFWRLLTVCAISVLWGVCVIYVAGASKEEREWAVKKTLAKFKKK